MKKNAGSTIIINVYGDNNTITCNDGGNSSKKTRKKSWCQALGKLIHSIVVNISVLLIETFTQL